MGSSAAAAMTGGAAMVPTDSSDMINARIIIGNLLKNAAVVAQPITPNKLKPWASLSAARDGNKVSDIICRDGACCCKKRGKGPGTAKYETRDSCQSNPGSARAWLGTPVFPVRE